MFDTLYYNTSMMLYHSSLVAPSSTGAGSAQIVSRVGKVCAAALLLVFSAAPAQAEPPTVVASFKPIHSLVAAIMEGVGMPSLLVKGAASPHTYALTPKDAAALQDAKLIFWIGDGMEHFLHKAIDTLPQDAKSVELAGIEVASGMSICTRAKNMPERSIKRNPMTAICGSTPRMPSS
jgi:ABC-type Zn2+ transport system substrate-binding protein/surface adhesin